MHGLSEVTMLVPRTRTFLPSVLLVSTLPWVLGAAGGAERARAISLYDQQLYVEALPLLERLRAEGSADGPILYRLAFAQLSTGDPAAAAETMGLAEAALESELAKTPDLERAYYLMNVYRQTQRPDDARAAARVAATLVESGKLPPSPGLATFQLGELYTELGNSEAAAEWYARSLDGLLADQANPAYVDRAGRILAERAWSASDWEKAAKYYGVVTENGTGTAANFDRLAVSHARLGHYDDAAKAWRRAELADPAEGDQARYMMRLANMAAELGTLPENAPDGAPWGAMGKAELAQAMKDQAGVVAQAAEQARAETAMTRERRAELQARMDAAKPAFVAAAMRYGLAGYGIRETAFFGGYAQLIFRPREWTVQVQPKRPGRPKTTAPETGER